MNSVSQDSNNVVANSDNMNMVMATILPVPGRKRRSFVGGSGSENNCTIENHAYLHIFQSVEVINDAMKAQCSKIRKKCNFKSAKHIFCNFKNVKKKIKKKKSIFAPEKSLKLPKILFFQS